MKKKLSPQRKTQLDRQAIGLCPNCGGEPEVNYVTCRQCLDKHKPKKERSK